MRPEHLHYDTVEEHLVRSIKEGKDFLFDSNKFEAELRRLWEDYDFPYQVRVCLHGFAVSSLRIRKSTS